MGFGTAIRTCFTNYATFTGRARRSEFWWFLLFFVVGRAASAMLDDAHGRGPMVEGAFAVACLIPLVAAGIRRLHDTGRSGAWILLGIGGLACPAWRPGHRRCPS